MANIIPAGSSFPTLKGPSDLTGFTLKETYKRLSDSLKVNSERDQSALLALANKFTTQIQSLNRATLNANDGISVTQVADSAMAQVEDGFQQLQELAVRGANSTLNDQDRQSLQSQATQIQEQINSLIKNTTFNEIPVLATNKSLVLQTGSESSEQTVISLKDFSNTFAAVDLSSRAGAETALSTLENNFAQVSQARSRMAAEQSGLVSTLNTLESRATALSDANTRFQSADIAQNAASLASVAIRAQPGFALQIQANQSPAQAQLLL